MLYVQGKGTGGVNEDVLKEPQNVTFTMLHVMEAQINALGKM